jgi:hypothetical protein
MVTLSASLDRVAAELAAQRAADQREGAEIYATEVAGIPQWNTTLYPNVFDPGGRILGPADGYAWAVHCVTAATFTAGTINLYKGQQADQNLRFTFLQPGAFYPPRTNFILKPGDRLTFAAATALAGNVTIALEVTQMTLRKLPKFLL